MENGADLIRVETFTKHEDADRARGFLQRLGVPGVVVIDKTSPAKDEEDRAVQGCVFDVMVPAVDAPRAIYYMEKEWNAADTAHGAFREDLPA